MLRHVPRSRIDVRIGTWNLDGRWTTDHDNIMSQLACDVWLLTEMSADAIVSGFHSHATAFPMTGNKLWSAILSTEPMEPAIDPHPASCAAAIGETLVCSSVLPWPLAGELWPWEPIAHQARLDTTADDLTKYLEGREVIWGGDWNQPLTGNLSGFTRGAQTSLLETLKALDLQVPTAALPGRVDGQASTDHIAVPKSWQINEAVAVRVASGLSDHDVYIIDAEPS